MARHALVDAIDDLRGWPMTMLAHGIEHGLLAQPHIGTVAGIAHTVREQDEQVFAPRPRTGRAGRRTDAQPERRVQGLETLDRPGPADNERVRMAGVRVAQLATH